MPLVCLNVPAFGVAVALAQTQGATPQAPFIVADRLERGRVVGASRPARALGVRDGMTLLQAQACAPEAQTLVHDAVRCRAVWEGILDALDAASPLIDDTGLGLAFIEMHGIEGTPERWIEIVARIVETAAEAAGLAPLEARIALGANRFTARAATLVGERCICPPGNEAALLAPLPLAVLELDAATEGRLALLGVKTLGELAALPHGPFVRRFGAHAAHWHACARGLDDRPLVPRPRTLRIERTRYGEGSATNEEQVLFALRTLVQRVADDIALTGKRARRLALTLECEDAETVTILARIAQPTARFTTLFDLLRARLEGIVLPAPVAGLRLAAQELEHGALALSLFAIDDPDPDAVALAIARIDAAFGEHRALRGRLIEGYRPEARFAYEPFDPALQLPAPPRPGDAEAPPVHAHFLPNRIRPRTAGEAGIAMQLRLHPLREVDVALREGKPAIVGTPPQAVLESAGPWRTDETWWTGLHARDDYDVLLEDGALVRLTREGARWYVVGTYD